MNEAEWAGIKAAQDRWAELEADKARWTDWRTIDTAPKDQIIWLGCSGSLRIGFWSKGQQWECHGTKGGGWRDHSSSEFGGMSSLTFTPTHWMPIPCPPA